MNEKFCPILNVARAISEVGMILSIPIDVPGKDLDYGHGIVTNTDCLEEKCGMWNLCKNKEN